VAKRPNCIFTRKTDCRRAPLQHLQPHRVWLLGIPATSTCPLPCVAVRRIVARWLSTHPSGSLLLAPHHTVIRTKLTNTNSSLLHDERSPTVSEYSFTLHIYSLQTYNVFSNILLFTFIERVLCRAAANTQVLQ